MKHVISINTHKIDGNKLVISGNIYMIDGKELFDYKQVVEKTGLKATSVHQYGYKYKLGKLYKINGMKRKVKLYIQKDIDFMLSRMGKVGRKRKRKCAT